MQVAGQELRFHPSNSLSAIFYFLFGSFLVWWSHDKIAVFNSVFDNALPKMIIWGVFLTMYALWLVVTPYLCLTGRSVGVTTFLGTFFYGFMGALAVIVGLPIFQTIITALADVFNTPMITGLGWIVALVAIFYLAFYKPVMILMEE